MEITSNASACWECSTMRIEDRSPGDRPAPTPPTPARHDGNERRSRPAWAAGMVHAMADLARPTADLAPLDIRPTADLDSARIRDVKERPPVPLDQAPPAGAAAGSSPNFSGRLYHGFWSDREIVVISWERACCDAKIVTSRAIFPFRHVRLTRLCHDCCARSIRAARRNLRSSTGSLRTAPNSMTNVRRAVGARRFPVLPLSPESCIFLA